MTESERRKLWSFLAETEKEIKRIEKLKAPGRRDIYLLDMCRYDVKRCRKELGLDGK